jgi:hypothetical protein
MEHDAVAAAFFALKQEAIDDVYQRRIVNIESVFPRPASLT